MKTRITCLLLLLLASAAMLLTAQGARAYVIITYDAAATTAVPASPWSVFPGTGGGSNTQAYDSGEQALRLVDFDGSTDGYLYRAGIPSAEINSEIDWNATLVGGIVSHSGNTAAAALQFSVADGSRNVWAGMRYTGANTEAYLMGGNGTIPIGGVVSVPGNPYLRLVIDKVTGPNPLGQGDDIVTLRVFDVSSGLLLGTTTNNVGNIGFATSAKEVLFGESSSSVASETIVRLATFTIPEPSAAAMLAALFAGAGLRLRRRG